MHWWGVGVSDDWGGGVTECGYKSARVNRWPLVSPTFYLVCVLIDWTRSVYPALERNWGCSREFMSWGQCAYSKESGCVR